MSDMTNAEKLIYTAIFDGAIKAGATRKAAEDNATMGVENYRQNHFNPQNGKKKSYKPVDLIEQRIAMAKSQKG